MYFEELKQHTSPEEVMQIFIQVDMVKPTDEALTYPCRDIGAPKEITSFQEINQADRNTF
ncbi:MAG TPA: hypothetical protein VGL94_13795 [Ktedonobacteraceae bacterium]